MALVLRDIMFTGPAMPEPFVLHELEPLLAKKKLLERKSKVTKKKLEAQWEAYFRKLRAMGERGGELRVLHHVIEPLVERLGYEALVGSEKVVTREGPEPGGYLLCGSEGAPHLRAWVVPAQTDLDAPSQRGRAHRYSPALIAQRVLLTKGEKIGLLTNGAELRVVLSDPSRRDSHLSIDLGRSGGWRGSRRVPDSYRLLRALCSPKGIEAIGELLDGARLAQSGVTKRLREQARRAVERFIQGLIDDPANREAREQWVDFEQTATQLWHEGLVFVYRLLFILKLETASDPARSFSFTTKSTWRNSFSPSTALAPIVEKIRDEGAETGGFLSESLRALFRLFAQGLSSSDLRVDPLGGMLFGSQATPLLDSLAWGEKAVADLLDALLWTIPDGKGRGKRNDAGSVGRERVHYGALDVEDLGWVYEALLELEPGITQEAMCRLRRAKLEVVVPLKQGAAYRKSAASDGDDGTKTKVVFVEEIPKNRFFLRVGLGRKASGSYYTPHALVRFLVRETLSPHVAERSPPSDPDPNAILGLDVLDPAMGSGHFLVEACRFLGEALYEACRSCDEQASEATRKADTTQRPQTRAELLERANILWQRVAALPDPKGELVTHLPSRILDADQSGLSQRKALALCRRLVAVHCLYGVDKNRLAVELARVSLWLESHAEGLPLTFLEHHLVVGDSLTGPFFEHLLTLPGTGQSAEQLHSGVEERLTEVLSRALVHVRDLGASVGKDAADLERVPKLKLNEALKPLRRLAAVWTGGVMLGHDSDDMGYRQLLDAVAAGKPGEAEIAGRAGLQRMEEVGHEGVPYELVFPEIFHPDGMPQRTGGFDAVVGNPPWEAIRKADDQFFAAYDLDALTGATKREKKQAQDRVLDRPDAREAYTQYVESFGRQDRIADRVFTVHRAEVSSGLAGRGTYDAYMLFGERALAVLRREGRLGMILPSAFHANEGATGLRRKLIRENSLNCCYSFENRKKLFEIDSRFKFAAIVVTHTEASNHRFQCAFYLHDIDWLDTRVGALEYTHELVERTGGEHLTFLELRSDRDVAVAARCFASERRFKDFATELDVRLSQEVNMTYEAERFTDVGDVSSSDPRNPKIAAELLAKGYVPLHEGKTFHQFDDRWGDRPRYVIALSDVVDKPAWTGPTRFYRAAFRDIASSTNERTGIFTLLPPGVLCGNKAPCEREPAARTNAHALKLVALANAFSFDFILRTKVQATVNLFMLNGCPVPKLKPLHDAFLAHASLRLVCNHAGYAPLWEEQLAGEWREPGREHSWPVLGSDDTRWLLRAAIDALVADAYGLDRSLYQHVLQSFSHSSYPKAPELCLAAFDELKSLGLEAFTNEHDPYGDIPLVTTLPEPVIELPAAPGVEPPHLRRRAGLHHG